MNTRVAGAGEATDALAGIPAVLNRIAAERDWPALEALYDRYWLALAAEFPGELVRIFDTMGVDELQQRPRLLFASLAARHAQAGYETETIQAYLRQYMDLGARLAAAFDPDTEESPGHLLMVGTAALASLRGRGRLAEAEALGRRLAERLAELNPLPGTEPVPRPGWLATQRGLTRCLLGDFSGATEQFRVAHEQARPEPVVFYAGANASANLAMLFAHLGHHGAVCHWLGELRSYPPLNPWARSIVGAGGRIAEGWQALDSYDRAGVDAVLDETGDGTGQAELWPFVTALFVARALHFGDPVAALAHIETIRLSHAPEQAGQGVAAQVLERARADLLLASGEPNRAARLVENAGSQTPHLALPAARLRLLNGDHELARTIAARGLWRTGSSRRDALQLLLVRAVAAWHMGERDEAARWATSAMRIRPPDEALSLSTLSPGDRDIVLTLAPNALSGRAAERLAAARAVFPARVRLVELTARERAVLTELRAGGNVPSVAQRLVVSVNTVRTQAQSAYRKLGVSSRQDAVMRASELGLL